MEKLGDILTDWFLRHRQDRKKFFHWLDRRSKVQLSLVFIFLFGILPLTVFFMLTGKHYGLHQILAHYLIVVLLFALVIVLAIFWYRAIYMEKEQRSGFTFKRLHPDTFDREYFSFDLADMANLERLFSQLPLEGRINMRKPAKNKNIGDVRFLFTFLDLTLVGGIRDFGPRSKESLQRFITDSFSLLGAEINPNTFSSSYSRWNQLTKRNSYVDTRKSMSEALGM